MKPSLGCRLPGLLSACLFVAGSGFSTALQAQSSCSSDGQPRPVALLERFISADCKDCWTDARTPRSGQRELALDWILPGSQGEDAPLSAVATRDALKRLEALGTPALATSVNSKTAVDGAVRKLRVAHGLPVSGYIGASIQFKGLVPKAAAQPWTAWLALVETIPTGTEGTPVPRNLVRNLVQSTWDGRQQLSNTEQKSFLESRSMDVPAGMNTERVRVIGWVQDAQGRIVAAAQSRCVKR